MRTTIAMATIIIGFWATVVIAQPSAPNPSAQIAEMKKVSFLQGKWKGEGWAITGPGGKHQFLQTEEVLSRLDGVLMTIEGKGMSKESASDNPRVVHHAFAALSFDAQEKKFKVRAFRREGMFVNADASVSDKGQLVWGFDIPNGGKVRYTIGLNDKGQWFEIGEFSRDGATWMQNFEMTLNKVQE